MRRFRALTAGLAAALAIGSVACTASSSGGRTVEVSLKDFELTVSPTTVPTGTIRLEATGEGPSVHELEVFEVSEDLDPAALPVDDGVAITEGLTLIDEVEDIVPGSTAQLTLDLDPGTYALICNLSGHYAHGMHATLTVG